MFIANCRSVAPILKEIRMDDLSQVQVPVQGATDLQLVYCMSWYVKSETSK